MVAASAADESYTLIVLVGHHAVAIDFLLVHPAVMMEVAREQRRVHQGRD